MKTKIKKEETEESNWISIIHNFAESFIARLGDNVMEKVDAWTNDLKIKAVSSIFMLVGMVFIFVGLAFYLNTLVGYEMRWVGFVLVGLIATLTGIIASRK